METTIFKAKLDALRDSVKGLVAACDEISVDLIGATPADGQNIAEMSANVTLALRHFEDAAMRLGKAIQAASGGVSPLGGPSSPGTGEASGTGKEVE